MAIKLEDVFSCINKSAETNQDPGAQAMAAAAQAATPPGGIPLPKPIEQPKEEGGENMVPEEKLQAEKEKLEAQRRAELEKKENEIRGLQHELDLERVERQKATAENELKEKSRQQEEKFRQEREKLDAERQKLEQDKAMQSNTQQAELIKHQADMERETSKQVADIAQQKAKAIEDIAKQNAQQYIRTTQQAQQQANRYFADQQKKFKESNPILSTTLQSRIGSAVSAAKSLFNHHRKIASYIPIPGDKPMEKKAINETFDTVHTYGGVPDVTFDIANYSPAEQAKYVAVEIARINRYLRDPEFRKSNASMLPDLEVYEKKLNSTLAAIDKRVKTDKSISPKDRADYELLTQPKTRYGQIGWSGVNRNAAKDIEDAKGFWGTIGSVLGAGKDYMDEFFDNSDVVMSDLDLIKNDGLLGKHEDLNPQSWGGKFANTWLGTRALNDTYIGRALDMPLGIASYGLGFATEGLGNFINSDALSGAGYNLKDAGKRGIDYFFDAGQAGYGKGLETIGDWVGSDSIKNYGARNYAAGRKAIADTKGANISGGLVSGTLGMLSPNHWRRLATNHDLHSTANDIIDKHGLSERDADDLRRSYDIASSPGAYTAGSSLLDVAGILPFARPIGRATRGVGNFVSRPFIRSSIPPTMGAPGAVERFVYKPLNSALNAYERLPVVSSWKATPMYVVVGNSLPRGSDVVSMYGGAHIARTNNAKAQKFRYRNQGSIPFQYMDKEIVQPIRKVPERMGREAFKYLRSDMKASGHRQEDIDSLEKRSATRVPMPGDLPLEKKSYLDDSLQRTARGRNMGYGWNQLNSPNYAMDKWSQNSIAEQIGKFLPVLNSVLGSNIRIDYNTEPAFNRSFKPLDAGQLSAIVFNPGSDPLANPKRKDNSIIYTNLKNSMARKYGYEKKQYTTIPTSESNVFSKPKTS